MKTNVKKIMFIYFIFLIASLIFSHPLFHKGFFDNHERLHYIVRISEVHDAVTNGQYYARWFSNLNGGYGYPFLNYYAPLVYYACELLHIIGLPIHTAIKFYLFLITLLGLIGIYNFSKNHFSQNGAVMCSFAYLFSPYHISNIYVRGDFPEYTAMALIPWGLYFIDTIYEKKGRGSFFLGVIFISLLILSHSISALFGFGLLAAYCMTLLIINKDKKDNTKTGLILALAFLFSLLLTIFFWFPALKELGYVNSQILTEGDINYKNHFVYPEQFVIPKWGFGLSVPSTNDGMPFQIGIMHLFFVATSLWIVFTRKKDNWVFSTNTQPEKWFSIFFITVFFAAIFFMMPFSAALYEIIPLIKFIQFPWRLLMFTSLASSIFAGLVFDFLCKSLLIKHPETNNPESAEKAKKITIILSTILIALFFAFYFPYIKVVGNLDIQHEYIGENTRQFFIHTSAGEYIPKTVKTMPTRLSARALRVISGEKISYEPESMKSVEYIFNIKKIKSTAILDFEVFYFPGWKVFLNDKEIPARASDPEGLIEFEISEPGLLKIVFMPTATRKFSTLISQFALFLLLLLALRKMIKK